ncbi:hypothetical protein Btru_023221 [Bulinus truncatus]|nr:hypothetical protein Btru_023221 [Bulinus truncatus]
MVSSCWAPNCTCRALKGSKKKMYRFPLSNPTLLNRWIIACKRLPPKGEKSPRPDGLHEPNEGSRLCACCHFVKGSKSDDPQDIDYVPTIFAHSSPKTKEPLLMKQNFSRHQRNVSRKRLYAAEALLSLQASGTLTENSVSCQTDMSFYTMNSVMTETNMRSSDIDSLVGENNELKSILLKVQPYIQKVSAS